MGEIEGPASAQLALSKKRLFVLFRAWGKAQVSVHMCEGGSR